MALVATDIASLIVQIVTMDPSLDPDDLLSLPLPSIQALHRELVTARSDVWYAESEAALESAVEDADTGPVRRMAFAQPDYGPENVFAGPDPWLWGFEPIEDPVAAERGARSMTCR